MPPSHLNRKCFFIKSTRKKNNCNCTAWKECLFIHWTSNWIVLWWCKVLPFDIVCYPIKTTREKYIVLSLATSVTWQKWPLFPSVCFPCSFFLQQPARILGYVVANVLFYDREDFALDVTCIHAKKKEIRLSQHRAKSLFPPSRNPLKPPLEL